MGDVLSAARPLKVGCSRGHKKKSNRHMTMACFLYWHSRPREQAGRATHCKRSQSTQASRGADWAWRGADSTVEERGERRQAAPRRRGPVRLSSASAARPRRARHHCL
jgi:hypothetical protein